MSENIRRALEIRLSALTPTLATAWENAAFNPVAGTPYQRADMIYAPPDNAVLGCNYRRELGTLQVRLFYPLNGGSANAQARADLIRSWFPRSGKYPFDGTNVLITRTPQKITLGTEGDRYVVAVRINFQAEIFG